MEPSDLIDGLSNPAAYPDPVDRSEVRQTHISVVFLTATHAYKVKKPVTFDFLDFGTLAKRLHFCEEEVRLNRRLAPDVYLGVVPITRDQQGLHFEGTGAAVEWAVKMRRLPDAATFKERLRRGDIDAALVEMFARRLADFHRAVAGAPVPPECGRFNTVARTLRDIFTRSEPLVGTTVSQTVFHWLRALTERTLSRFQQLIEDRAERGLPRDSHGDLHLDHIYYFPDRAPPDDLVIVDCIEFNERFRFIDPVADMAFADMDFRYHGRHDLADALAATYFRATGDDSGRALLPLYSAFRASVRGSVAGLKLGEREVPAAERSAEVQKARAHWLLALGTLEAPSQKPALVMVGGLPGTGKSTLARALAGRGAHFELVRSDVVRKDLAGLSSDKPAPSALRRQLYSSEADARTYAECLRRAEGWLFEGKRVLVDATFRAEEQRTNFLAAARWAVPAQLFVTLAKPQTVQYRLQQRRGDASDADWQVSQQIAGSWEEPGPTSRRAWWTIDTNGSAEDALVQALARLQAGGIL